jgi:CHASE3 domain sensor protein
MLTFAGIALELVGVVGVVWWAVHTYRRATSALAADPPGFHHTRDVYSRIGEPSPAQLADEVDKLKGAIKNEINAAMHELHLERVQESRHLLQRERRANQAALVSAGAILIGGGLQAVGAWPW